MTGTEINEIKWKVISPMIDEMIYQYKHQRRTDYAEYTKDCFQKVEKKLISYNFPNDTFLDLNKIYRKRIQEEMLKIR